VSLGPDISLKDMNGPNLVLSIIIVLIYHVCFAIGHDFRIVRTGRGPDEAFFLAINYTGSLASFEPKIYHLGTDTVLKDECGDYYSPSSPIEITLDFPLGRTSRYVYDRYVS